MKLWERVIETKICDQVKVTKNQFGFLAGRSIMEPIHFLRNLMDKYRECSRDLHVMFIDYEKAYVSVRRIVLWTSLVANGVSSVIYVSVL